MADKNGLVRVGRVSSVDSGKRAARVIFPGLGNMVSDWLPILWYPGVETTSNGSHQHDIKDDPYTDVTAFGGYHSHEVKNWMPRVDDRVLVIMEYGFNSSGYIVGVIP